MRETGKFLTKDLFKANDICKIYCPRQHYIFPFTHIGVNL